jgi:phenylpyruvate tautomerase PptA (4-oxalocrotonate tautomerase family)
MPLITITLAKGKSAADKRAIADEIHNALVKSGIPEKDRFQRLIELDDENFIYDATYPNLSEARSKNFIVIEVLLSVGRSVKVKKEMLKTMIANLQQNPGLNPNDVMIVFKETQWENWAFANGEQIHI